MGGAQEAEGGSREWWLAKEFPPDSPMHCGIRERFLARLAVGDGCWLWTGHRYKAGGYGRFRAYGRALRASRVAWEMANGRAVPDGLHILHACDTPACSRPSHLRPGTDRDNMQDALQRGRHGCQRNPINGEGAPWHRLTEGQVREIIATGKGYGNGAALARKFGVSLPAINHVLSGKTWPHIDRDSVQPAPRRAGRNGVL